MMEKTMTGIPVGSWERPDAGGIVRRGEAVSEFTRGYKEKHGAAPHCFALHAFGCERESVMEVYGLHFCEAHGEEAASAAFEEIYYDLERRIVPDDSDLNPHVEHAFRLAMKSVPPYDGDDSEAALLKAYPLDENTRQRVEAETPLYIEEPDDDHLPPFDAHLGDRLLVCRHMRLAFEEGATWLVEMLEKHREYCAAQAAYALALENEAGLR
ncbi:hypothetical protein BH24ACT22_BH24ACT22_18220 [soil metagenome]